MLNLFTLSVFFIAWGMMSAIGAISLLSTADDNFTNVTDASFSGQNTVIDNPPFLEGASGLGTVLSLPNTATNWLVTIAKSATFQAPFWDSTWTNPIRWLLATIGAAFIGVIMIKGVELLRG